MQLKKGEIITLKIEKLALGGQGIGKWEGRVCFVNHVVPGDTVEASLTKIKPKRLEARLVKVLESSDLRVAPKCKHFEKCGGCVWQFLPYEEQLKFKEEQVRETLQHLGGFSGDEVREILGCAKPWHYRNKMEFSFGMEEEKVMLGLHLPKRRYDVFDLEECYLCAEVAAEIVKKVRNWANEEGLVIFDNHHQDGLLRNLIIREGKNTGELMVNLETSENSFPCVDSFRELFKDDERITSLIWSTVMQRRGTPTYREYTTLAGRGAIFEEMNLPTGESLKFEIAPDAFFQPNTHQAEKLYAEALQAADLTGGETVYDLYCGTGTIGLFCAHQAARVVGIEINKNAILNARENAERNNIKNAEFFVGDTGKALKEHALPKPDVIIVDPPRAGLQGDTPEQVASLRAKRIVYVSCNPATLTRDLKTFTQNNYQLEYVQPVDMFPHTYHIENVAVLTYQSK
jgi:23S rRNA (uracil1939-C5)-methyltransferase